jgi:DNA-binding helix-hairpin-helix protein with protein kinase domain
MNHKAKIQAAIVAAKASAESVKEEIKWMAEAQPGKINAIFIAGAVNDDEGTGVTYSGSSVGDSTSLIAALVNALDNQPELAVIMVNALEHWQSTPCNCPNCAAERALQNMFNKSKN